MGFLFILFLVIFCQQQRLRRRVGIGSDPARSPIARAREARAPPSRGTLPGEALAHGTLAVGLATSFAVRGRFGRVQRAAGRSVALLVRARRPWAAAAEQGLGAGASLSGSEFRSVIIGYR